MPYVTKGAEVIFTTAYTPSHWDAAMRLIASLDRLNLSISADAIPARQTAIPWLEVVRGKPNRLYDVAKCEYITVWLDADCEVIVKPDLFWHLGNADIALPRRPSGEWMTGVVAVRNTKMGLAFLRDWQKEIDDHPDMRDGEAVQAVANNPVFRIRPLPPSYDWIPTMSDREHPKPETIHILHHGGTVPAPGREEVRR